MFPLTNAVVHHVKMMRTNTRNRHSFKELIELIGAVDDGWDVVKCLGSNDHWTTLASNTT